MPSSVAPERRGRRAAILLASLSNADATSRDALAMATTLRQEGWEARVFAPTRPADAPAEGLAEAARFVETESPVTIYHSGGRWDDGMELLRRSRGPIVVRDHNVTPAAFFSGLSAEFVDAAERGAEQRAVLARDSRVARFLAASPRNADDLTRLGAPEDRIRVVPPFHGIDELIAAEPDGDALRLWQSRPAATFVGRVAPNKGHRRLLRIARIYQELFGELLPLRLVGSADPRLHAFTGMLDRERDHHALRHSVEFVGSATLGQLKAAYLTASVFLCASEHEGFCVPLVEATAFGVPIVAAQEPGVARTLGPDGLVLDGDDALMATAVHRVLRDRDLRQALVRAQQRRLRALFSGDVLHAALVDALAEL